MQDALVRDSWKEACWADRLLCGSFCLMFFFLPFTTSPTVIAGLLSIAIWAFSGKAIREWRSWLRQEWTVPVFLFIIIYWLGLLWTNNLAAGHTVAGKSYYWLLTFAIASLSFSTCRPHWQFVSYLAGLSFNVAVSIAQFAGILPSFKEKYGFMGYISYSLLLVLGMLILSFYYKHSDSRRQRLFLLGLMLAFLFNLAILSGRSGYLAFILLSPLMFINIFGRKRLKWVAAVSLVAVALLFLSPTVQTRIGLVKDEISSYYNNGEVYTSVGSRLHVFKGAVLAFVHNPILGVGTGGSAIAIKTYLNDPQFLDFAHPHNSFLYIAMTYGLVGLVPFFWLLFLMLRKGWRARDTLTGFAVLSFALVFIIGSLTDTHILSLTTGYLFALMTGIDASAEHGFGLPQKE